MGEGMTELEIVRDPLRWPLKSVLCLAHRRDVDEGLPSLGVVLRADLDSGCDRGRPRVYLGELEIVLARLEAGETVRTRSYETWAALLEDWRLD